MRGRVARGRSGGRGRWCDSADMGGILSELGGMLFALTLFLTLADHLWVIELRRVLVTAASRLCALASKLRL